MDITSQDRSANVRTWSSRPAGRLPFFLVLKSDRKLSPEILVQQANTFQLTIDSIGEMANSGEKFTHSMITANAQNPLAPECDRNGC